jgi:hypothetical protein
MNDLLELSIFNFKYILNCASKNQRAAHYMVNKVLLVLLPMAIETSSACLAVAGLPVEQRKLGKWHNCG